MTGTIGGITTPTVNISGIPLGISVGGVVGDPVNGITLFRVVIRFLGFRWVSMWVVLLVIR
ncbi:putative membrane protein [Mycobacterium kansasii 732]|nr:putative membrane protein [Mycobacterium kansasii 732]